MAEVQITLFAALELLVHVEPLAAPDDLVAVQIELPEDLAQRRLVPADLPPHWRTAGRAELRALGAEWIRAQEPFSWDPRLS